MCVGKFECKLNDMVHAYRGIFIEEIGWMTLYLQITNEKIIAEAA